MLLKREEIQPIVNGPTIAGRRVDGTEIRAKLGIELVYPSWRTGVPASL
jgi:hypothetical protein